MIGMVIGLWLGFTSKVGMVLRSVNKLEEQLRDYLRQEMQPFQRYFQSVSSKQKPAEASIPRSDSAVSDTARRPPDPRGASSKLVERPEDNRTLPATNDGQRAQTLSSQRLASSNAAQLAPASAGRSPDTARDPDNAQALANSAPRPLPLEREYRSGLLPESWLSFVRADHGNNKMSIEHLRAAILERIAPDDLLDVCPHPSNLAIAVVQVRQTDGSTEIYGVPLTDEFRSVTDFYRASEDAVTSFTEIKQVITAASLDDTFEMREAGLVSL
jgi:hypothetical protein